MLCGVLEVNVKVYCGVWNKQVVGSFEVCGKKLGIIGYGYIGIQFGILVELLGMYVFFYDIENKLLFGNVIQVQYFFDLLNMSDVVSLYVLENVFIKNMMGVEELVLMKLGVLLINVFCGIVVDILVLCDVLVSKYLVGVVIDVFLIEFVINSDFFILLLCEFDNVIFILYIGGFIQEVQENIGLEVVGKLVKYFDNGLILLVVNFLEVFLLLYGGCCLLYIYEN